MTHRTLITQDDVRKAGGIVHRDGNIFFTNIDQLNESARQYLAAPEQSEHDDSLKTAMHDVAISWCDSNGIDVLEPEQLARLVNSLYVTVLDHPAPKAEPEASIEQINNITGAA